MSDGVWNKILNMEIITFQVTRPSPSDHHHLLIPEAADVWPEIAPEVSGLQMLAGTERGIPSSIFQAPQGSRVWSPVESLGEGKPHQTFHGTKSK